MKHLLSAPASITILLICLPCCCVFGQTLAGEVPMGSSILLPAIDLVVIKNEHDTITYLDIDKDGYDDVQIWLLKGNTPSDGPNGVYFFPLDSKYSFCVDQGNPGNIVLYTLGDTLCNQNTTWNDLSMMTVGCYGSWNCSTDTAAINNVYVAYKDPSEEIGWLKVSMSLYAEVDQIPVTFSMSEMLVPFIESGTSHAQVDDDIVVVPNPSRDGVFVVNGAYNRIEIFNSSSQLVSVLNDKDTSLMLPSVPGVYFLKIAKTSGEYFTKKIIRL